LMLMSGDKECQHEARNLFASTIPTYRSTDCVAVLTQQTVFGVIKYAKTKL